MEGSRRPVACRICVYALAALLQSFMSCSAPMKADPRIVRWRSKVQSKLRGFGGHLMADKKTIFVAFAIEDERSRDFLKGQSLHTRSPFEYVDMSVKEPYDANWKDRVRTRIKRSHGVIALVSKNSLNSSGQKWEIQCANEEGKPLLGIWCYKEDRTSLAGVNTKIWTWDNIKNFIDSL